MGQYYRIVNLDKRQYLDPHAFGEGMKLLEFATSSSGILTALAVLLASGNGRGDGDLLDCPCPVVGSWAGDRIVVAGDYADRGLFVTQHDAEALWRRSSEEWPLDQKTGAPRHPTLYQVAAECFVDVSAQALEAMTYDRAVAKDIAERVDGGCSFYKAGSLTPTARDNIEKTRQSSATGQGGKG